MQMVVRPGPVRHCRLARFILWPRSTRHIADWHLEAGAMRIGVERRASNAVRHGRATNRMQIVHAARGMAFRCLQTVRRKRIVIAFGLPWHLLGPFICARQDTVAAQPLFMSTDLCGG
jgi:hypothetical protein